MHRLTHKTKALPLRRAFVCTPTELTSNIPPTSTASLRKTLPQDAQKGRPARPQANRNRRRTLGGTLRTFDESRTKLADFFSILLKFRNRVDDKLKPGRDGFLPIPLFVLTVPHGKRHGLHPAGNQLGFVLLLFTHQGSAHDDMPHPVFPRSLPLDSALLLFGRQGTKAPTDEVLDRRDPARNDFKRPSRRRELSRKSWRPGDRYRSANRLSNARY